MNKTVKYYRTPFWSFLNVKPKHFELFMCNFCFVPSAKIKP